MTSPSLQVWDRSLILNQCVVVHAEDPKIAALQLCIPPIPLLVPFHLSHDGKTHIELLNDLIHVHWC